MLFSKDLDGLFASDLVYNGVHLWLGPGVDLNAIENWKAAISDLKGRYGSPRIKVFPGHGKTTDSRIFDTDLLYISALLAAVKSSKTQPEAREVMLKKYPGWGSVDFILAQSIKNQFQLIGK